MYKSIGDLLSQFLAGRLSNKEPLEAQLMDTWKRLMGPDIAQATPRIVLQGRSCIIYVRDSVIREELRYQTSSILELLRSAGFSGIRRVEIRGG
ncbi:MAG: DUF721 domain-containing protein [Bacteroidia bacterium]|nr:DUF721 domain-containing protein [Bacteroidia bacterium]